MVLSQNEKPKRFLERTISRGFQKGSFWVLSTISGHPATLQGLLMGIVCHALSDPHRNSTSIWWCSIPSPDWSIVLSWVLIESFQQINTAQARDLRDYWLETKSWRVHPKAAVVEFLLRLAFPAGTFLTKSRAAKSVTRRNVARWQWCLPQKNKLTIKTYENPPLSAKCAKLCYPLFLISTGGDCVASLGNSANVAFQHTIGRHCMLSRFGEPKTFHKATWKPLGIRTVPVPYAGVFHRVFL